MNFTSTIGPIELHAKGTRIKGAKGAKYRTTGTVVDSDGFSNLVLWDNGNTSWEETDVVERVLSGTNGDSYGEVINRLFHEKKALDATLAVAQAAKNKADHQFVASANALNNILNYAATLDS